MQHTLGRQLAPKGRMLAPVGLKGHSIPAAGGSEPVGFRAARSTRNSLQVTPIPLPRQDAMQGRGVSSVNSCPVYIATFFLILCQLDTWSPVASLRLRAAERACAAGACTHLDHTADGVSPWQAGICFENLALEHSPPEPGFRSSLQGHERPPTGLRVHHGPEKHIPKRLYCKPTL